MTNYEYDDLMLQFEQMRAQGWDPLLCDTPVPYYDGRVPHGHCQALDAGAIGISPHDRRVTPSITFRSVR